MSSDAVLGKVTAFVTRETTGGRELLVFRHPNAGVQLPAGTIEPGESPEDAVLREVWEETGLTSVEVVRCLDIMAQPLAADEYVLLQSAQLLSASVRNAVPIDALLHRGWRVRLKQIDGEFAEVAYEDFEMRDRLVVKSAVEGWLPADTVTQRVERHLFHLRLTAPTPDRWEQFADMGFTFELYWTALDEIDDLVPVQQDWLNSIRDQLQNR
jgi:8-oxo-dGTP pyrophosphatase MutT (NUDIX family)